MIETARSVLQVVDLRTRPELLEQVAQWHQQAWQQQDLFRRRERLQLHLGEAPLPTTLVALDDEAARGSASLVRYQKLGGYEASVWLANVFVRTEYRNRGIGADLVAAAVARASELEVPQLYLYTHDHERYYTQLGWQAIKQHSFAGRSTTIMRLVLDQSMPRYPGRSGGND